MSTIITKFENWLRIDPGGRISDSLRARAVYFICAVLIIAQVFNLVNMSHTYGKWTSDHSITLAATGLLAASIPVLRYNKKYYLFAGYYSILLFLSIIGASMLDTTGINSALLPYLLLGTIVNGFISGWRAVIGYGIASLGLVWLLFAHSAAVPAGALFDPILFEARNFQRAMQVSIVMVLASAITSFASYAMHKAFFDLEEQAENERQASKAKTEFLANLSHELRTPLNGVMGMSGLLQNTKLDNTQKEYVKIIHDCSKNLGAILEDVLDLSKLDESRIAVKMDEMNLRDELDAILKLFKPAATAKNLVTGIRYSGELPKSFIGDAGIIRKIISNLFSNAIKFTDKGSVFICVDGKNTEQNQYEITISVQDTGVGIAKKDIDKIFSRFAQLDTRLSRNNDGTGLGLAISQKLAELLGGQIDVITRPDEGSTFSLQINMQASRNENIFDGTELFHGFSSQVQSGNIRKDNSTININALTKDDIEIETIPLYCETGR